MSQSSLVALVHAVRYEADGVVSVELRPGAPGVLFPEHSAGAHIDFHLPNGLVRSYSLCNPQGESQRYVIGVLNDRRSRGGSRYIHEQLRVGSVVQISSPRNHFSLFEDAQRSVLVAGGIGITPVFAMFQRLATLRRSVKLVYCARNRREAAFQKPLAELAGPDVEIHWHFDDEEGGASPDLKALLGPEGSKAHFYCCGPTPMLAAFEKTLDFLEFPNCHIERFAVPVISEPRQHDKSYVVELARSGKVLEVPVGKSLLDSLIDAGLDCAYSCKEGVCGACETRVLAGEIDHRDGILSNAERAAMNAMMICVSGCRSDRLVLDL